MAYRYETCCVHSTASAINAMVDRASDVTYGTLSRRVGTSELSAVFPDYDWGPKAADHCGLRLRDDWAVSFYRSRYRGRRCYYVKHSAIEYIFTEVRQ